VNADTCLLSVINASNISSAKIDLQKTPVDGINIAPYFFGCLRLRHLIVAVNFDHLEPA
jgi:hypothetical protein